MEWMVTVRFYFMNMHILKCYRQASQTEDLIC